MRYTFKEEQLNDKIEKLETKLNIILMLQTPLVIGILLKLIGV